MPDTEKPLLVKRYASRRLYNTETSDYVTLDDISRFIRAGRDVKIVDLKTGDDLTRQYLLQIVAEHEGRGESVLPIAVLTDLVRSYTTQAQSVVPQFLAMSFEMLRDGQSKMMENLTTMPSPMNPMSGIEAMQRQQKAFLASVMPGWPGTSGKPDPDGEQTSGEAKALAPPEKAQEAAGETAKDTDDLHEIRRQLSDLQKKLAKLDQNGGNAGT